MSDQSGLRHAPSAGAAGRIRRARRAGRPGTAPSQRAAARTASASVRIAHGGSPVFHRRAAGRDRRRGGDRTAGTVHAHGEQIKNALVLGAIYALVADRVHDGVRHHRADQLRPRRRLHRCRASTRSSSAGRCSTSIALATQQLRRPAARARHRLSALDDRRRHHRGGRSSFVAYRRLRDSPRLAPLITAIGVSFLIEGIMLAPSSKARTTSRPAGLVDQRARVHRSVGSAFGWTDLFVVAWRCC